MADLTLEVAQSHREAPHQTGFSTKQHAAKRKKRKKKPPVQLIAQKFVSVLKYSPDQPRDAEGQWTRSGSGPSLPKVEGILDAIGRADGGFTYHAVTGDQPKVGFALSLHPDREAIMDDSKATVVALASYAAKNWDLLKDTNNYMGGWHNPEDGKVYLDVSTVVETAAEAERLCREANQIAYFDLVKGQSIKVAGGRHAKAARETRFESYRTTNRPADYRGHHRPLQAVDGTGSHAGGSRAGATDSLAAVLKFDPNQPRDEEGQWTTTGDPFAKEREQQERFTAVNGYVHGNFHWLNKVLRKEDEKNFADDLKYQIQTLDKAMQPLPQAETVHRIVRDAVIRGIEVGDVFEDRGYISTTRDEGMLGVIRNDLGYTSLSLLTHIKIEVPKGTGHLDVNKEMGDHPYGNQYAHQQEVILPRGTQFEVVGKSEEKDALGVMRPVLHVRVTRG
jgi:hypothetical protein